jgi:hypothetical protein
MRGPIHFAVDAVARPLADRNPRSLPMPGPLALGLGGCLTAFTGGMLALTLPRVLNQGGAIILVAGLPAAGLVLALGLSAYGAASLVRHRRGKRVAAERPGEPWLADWPWEPSGVAAEPSWSAASLGALLVGILLVAVFTGVFVQYALPSPELHWGIKAAFGFVVLLWDWLLLQAAFKALRDGLRTALQGPARLQFARFPFLLGQRVDVQLLAKSLAGRDDVVVTLRCLDERLLDVTVGLSRRRTTVSVQQLYEARAELPIFDGDAGARLAIPLPDGDLGTRLSAEPPRYWELEVTAGNLEPIRFLVPVYAPGS